MSKFKLKTKTWIENDQGELLFGKGKIELLQAIDQTGSLLAASKKLNINYKKAWLYLRDLEKNSQEILVISKQGRSTKPSTRLTKRALELINSYFLLQQDIENYANKRFEELFLTLEF